MVQNQTASPWRSLSRVGLFGTNHHRTKGSHGHDRRYRWLESNSICYYLIPLNLLLLLFQLVRAEHPWPESWFDDCLTMVDGMREHLSAVACTVDLKALQPLTHAAVVKVKIKTWFWSMDTLLQQDGRHLKPLANNCWRCGPLSLSSPGV